MNGCGCVPIKLYLQTTKGCWIGLEASLPASWFCILPGNKGIDFFFFLIIRLAGVKSQLICLLALSKPFNFFLPQLLYLQDGNEDGA